MHFLNSSMITNAGGSIALDKVICADTSMSSKEVWCNESQERYALAIVPTHN